jgi:bacterioferritin-associated ferredoxin
MLVCHCKNVSDREIRAAVRGGARTRVDVARACEAGSRCGSCSEAVEDILSSEIRVRRTIRLEPSPFVAAAAG